MRCHVAILQQPYLNMVLSGSKTIESRMTQRPIAPYAQIEPGDRIYFKKSAGPFMGAAIAGEVDFYDRVSPATMDQIKREFNNAIGGDDGYWQRKAKANFASLIKLTHVVPIEFGPAFPKSNGLAWFVLDEKTAQTAPRIAGLTITEGAIRNGYLRVGRAEAATLGLANDASSASRAAISLTLPDGRNIETSLTSRGMLRWRGWSSVYRNYSVQPGDRATLVENRGGGFAVVFHSNVGSRS